ncbi:hypothetical protein J6590_069915 [Homalodisca vitripennis]|nr:hypothetical protein J6590_069915 [Homalodisca vitripennis]
MTAVKTCTKQVNPLVNVLAVLPLTGTKQPAINGLGFATIAHDRTITELRSTDFQFVCLELFPNYYHQRPDRRVACKDRIAQRSLIQAAATLDVD